MPLIVIAIIGFVCLLLNGDVSQEAPRQDAIKTRKRK
jgi:hypothetical protein